MNRTFLIFLMIGTAMMITVIGHHEPTTQLDTMPWEVDQLDNNSLRVFGITLGKTSIQEANQIFASFGKTQLQVTTDINKHQTFQLVTNYEDLIIGGLIAEIKLTYLTNQKELKAIFRSLEVSSNKPKDEPKLKSDIQFYSVNKKIEINHLSAPVSQITYTPSIDYGQEELRQNFGLAAEEIKLSDDELLWIYPEMGLKIHIHRTQPDHFVYAPLK